MWANDIGDANLELVDCKTIVAIAIVATKTGQAVTSNG